MERELTGPVDLCRADGTLNPEAVGWTRRPFHRCNLDGACWGRRKSWDYWCVSAENLILAVTISDVDYLGLASFYFCDLTTRTEVEKTLVFPFGARIRLPVTVEAGEISVTMPGTHIAFRSDAAGTRIELRAKTRKEGRLDADLLVALPEGHETLGVVIPWSDRRFQYTSKHNARPVIGRIQCGTREYALGPETNAFGCLDFGRGVWPYRISWNWGSASGPSGGSVVGLQLGGQWTDGTGATENSITVDGMLSKISDDLRWGFSRRDPFAPWRIVTAASAQVDLTFTPVHVHSTRIELGVAGIDIPQYIGHFDGTVVDQVGRPVAIEHLFGWAEDARLRW